MGNLQRFVRLAELGDRRLCPFVQLLLDCSHYWFPRNAIQRENRSLAINEAQSCLIRQEGEQQQQRGRSWDHVSREERRRPRCADEGTKCRSFTICVDSVSRLPLRVSTRAQGKDGALDGHTLTGASYALLYLPEIGDLVRNDNSWIC